jgi:hypothetical protein
LSKIDASWPLEEAAAAIATWAKKAQSLRNWTVASAIPNLLNVKKMAIKRPQQQSYF